MRLRDHQLVPGGIGLTTIPRPHAVAAGGVRGGRDLYVLAQVPEERVWLANFPSRETRKTYRAAVASFVRAFGLTSAGDFSKVTRAAVIAWRDQLVREGRTPRTVRARLAALSSLFLHLQEQNLMDTNPAEAVKRPELRVRRGETKALSVKQARKLIDTRRGRHGADPFVIALAKTRGLTVVTDEHPTGSPNRPHIPDVCRAEQIPYINMLELIRRHDWKF